jgi:hypothetical protein
MKERLGLWLAYWALRITGNPKLATVSTIIHLIPERRLVISLHSIDRALLERAGPGTWVYWTSGEGKEI